MLEEEIFLMQKTYDAEIASNKPNSKITMGISAKMVSICDLLEKNNDYSQINRLRLISPLFDDFIWISEVIQQHRKSTIAL